MDYVIKRWCEDTDDPNMRCQYVSHKGQCFNVAVAEGKNCYAHGGHKTLQSQREESLRNYRLGIFQARVDEFADSSKIKSIREEIAIIRMLIEERFRILTKPTDIILHSTAISDLVMKVEKLVTTCNKLEVALGTTLDKQVLMQIAINIIEILKKYITDPEVLEAVASDIITLINDPQGFSTGNTDSGDIDTRSLDADFRELDDA